MKWYLKVVRDNYANFSGRARRQEYWMFVLFNVIFSILAMLLDITLGITIEGVGVGFSYGYGPLYMIYSLAVLIPKLAVTIRRLHDVGKSGWMFLIILIPLIGVIWLLVLKCTEGEKGANQYGLDPKSE